MISVAPSETENALLLNPMTVKDGEPSIIKERILEVMGWIEFLKKPHNHFEYY